MCGFRGILFKCNCSFVGWIQCDYSMNKNRPHGFGCTLTSAEDKVNARLVPNRLDPRYTDKISKIPQITAVTVDCSPACCQARLSRRDSVIGASSGIPQENAKKAYFDEAHQHMSMCMAAFANGIWKTNAMRVQMEENPLVQETLLAVSQSRFPDHYDRAYFNENRLPHWKQYKDNVAKGKGILGLQAGSIKIWNELCDHAKNWTPASNTPPFRPLTVGGHDFLPLFPPSGLASAPPVAPPTGSGDTAAVRSSRPTASGKDSAKSSGVPQENSQSGSSSRRPPEGTASRSSVPRSEPPNPFGEFYERFDDPVPWPTFAESDPKTTSKKRGPSPRESIERTGRGLSGSPQLAGVLGKSRENSPLRKATMPPLGSTDALAESLDFPLRISVSPERDPDKWTQVCVRSRAFNQLRKVMQPVMQSNCASTPEQLHEMDRVINKQLEDFDKNSLKDFASTQREQLYPAEVARSRWLSTKHVVIKQNLEKQKALSSFSTQRRDKMIEKVGTLLDKLRQLEREHDSWMKTMKPEEQRKMHEALAEMY